MSPLFQKPLSLLVEGQTSEPIETPNGYYIFKLETRQLGKSQDFEKSETTTEARLRQQEVMRHTITWIEDQRRRSDIRVLK